MSRESNKKNHTRVLAIGLVLAMAMVIVFQFIIPSM